MKASALYSLTVLALCNVSEAFPQPVERATCTTQAVRREWSTLTAGQKANYISAVQCLTTRPSKMGLDQFQTLYDDFTLIHCNGVRRNHGTAYFLPWHRLFIQYYENALKTCGYHEALPYWDFEAAANKDMTTADIWRPDTGFGGDGRREPFDPTADVQCVTNGPFSYFRPYWTDSANACFYSQHCLKRQWLLANETDGTFQRNLFAEAYDTPAMNVVRSKTTFRTFAPALEGDAHNRVHAGIGGDIGPPGSSPNDPLFFPFHANVDRTWWLWQQQDPSKRNVDFEGDAVFGQPVSINDTLFFSDLYPDVTVRQVMTTNNDVLCYKYA